MQIKPFVSKSNVEVMQKTILAFYNINNMRNLSLVNNEIGPRVLIMSSNIYLDGKSFCHILLNYSLKIGWTPIYCDLDLNNEINIPGCISATVVDHIVPNDFLIDNSISFYNGTRKENLNNFLFENQISELGKLCIEKLEYDLNSWKKSKNLTNDNSKSYFVNCEYPTLYSSGIIINCPSLEIIDKDRENSIYSTIIKDFKINLIYVIDNEILFYNLQNLIDKNKISIILIPKIEGIEKQNRQYQSYMEEQKLSFYFKGTNINESFEDNHESFTKLLNIKLTEFKLDLKEYKLIQIVSSNVSSDALPIEGSSNLNLVINEYKIDNDTLYRIVEIVSLEDKDINELNANFEKSKNNYVDLFSRAPVSFFGVIIKVNENSKSITICSPYNQLKHKYILIGDLKYSKYFN
jgi:hypothetical protein